MADIFPIIDCHVHVFDPSRFPYAPDAGHPPSPAETGTPDSLGMAGCTPYRALVSDWLPNADDRRAVLCDTPKRLFGFGT